jgi:outer membrane protein insertion porin family
VAGLGGSSHFVKSDLSGRWHYPLLKAPDWGGNYTLALGGALGYGVGYSGRSDLPLFERYFPGGINSVRGFQDRSLGPRDGDDLIGGDKQAIVNVELLFPIMERIGLRGVVFFDMGQAFRESDTISFGDFRRSVGVGGRWMSPFGPLRVELGIPLNKKPGDETSLFGFSLGGQ